VLVVDWDKSERHKQRRKTRDGRQMHCCCICLNCEPWSSSWSYYASIREEDDSAPFPKFCSEACKAKAGPACQNVTDEMKVAAKNLEWRDPEIVYREASGTEKYRAAVQAQKPRGAP
jgi:hypothetical protein